MTSSLQSFYSTAAQIAPVVLLALLAETALLRLVEFNRWLGFTSIILSALPLIYATGLCLNALASNKEGPGGAGLVIFLLAIPAVQLVVVVGTLAVADSNNRQRTRRGLGV